MNWNLTVKKLQLRKLVLGSINFIIVKNKIIEKNKLVHMNRNSNIEEE